METKEKTYEEYDIICLPSKDYSRLVLYKGAVLHQTRHYGTAWDSMGDTYADLYVLANVETDKYEGRPCEDGAVCFAHQTKPCDKCGRYQGRTIVSSTNKIYDYCAVIPDSYLPEYVVVYSGGFFDINNDANRIRKITLETRLAGVCCSPMEGGIRHHSDCDKCSGYTEEYIPQKDTEGYAIVKPKEEPNCGKHQRAISGYSGSMEMLANDIGNMHYESLSEFLAMLVKKINEDASKDRERGRIKLAMALFGSSASLSDASSYIYEAWEISKPFMK